MDPATQERVRQARRALDARRTKQTEKEVRQHVVIFNVDQKRKNDDGSWSKLPLDELRRNLRRRLDECSAAGSGRGAAEANDEGLGQAAGGDGGAGQPWESTAGVAIWWHLYLSLNRSLSLSFYLSRPPYL